MYSLKILILMFFIVFVGCFPEPPVYKREIDETIMSVSGGFQQEDTAHYIYLEYLYECSEYGSFGNCDDLNEFEHGIDSALIQITIGDSIYIGKKIEWHSSAYQFDFLINRGDSITLFATHPDYEPAWASIVVPDELEILHSISSVQNTNILKFDWTAAENAIGYDSHLYIVGINDTSEVRYKLEDGFDKNENTSWDDKPSKRKYYSISINDILEQVIFKIEIGDIPEDFLQTSNLLYLQLDVWALDEAYYYTNLSLYNPDEYSGFSASLIQYSNIENGVGVLGAYWITKSDLIEVTEFLK